MSFCRRRPCQGLAGHAFCPAVGPDIPAQSQLGRLMLTINRPQSPSIALNRPQSPSIAARPANRNHGHGHVSKAPYIPYRPASGIARPAMAATSAIDIDILDIINCNGQHIPCPCCPSSGCRPGRPQWPRLPLRLAARAPPSTRLARTRPSALHLSRRPGHGNPSRSHANKNHKGRRHGLVGKAPV